jgi:hypothetical protein
MSTGGYTRRRRAPKPLRVPAIGALLGAALFVVGMILASEPVASLGMLIAFWGVLSFAVLAISRRVRAARSVGPRV